MVSDELREAAWLMYHELRTNRLEVVLAPSHDSDMAMRGGKIRVVVSYNPQWYQDFCADYTKRRKRPRHRQKHDTSIKRSHTLRALMEIYEGQACTVYAQRLLPIVAKRNGAYLRGEW